MNWINKWENQEKRVIFPYSKDFKINFPGFCLVCLVINITGGKVEKSEGDRKVKEEKKYRGIHNKKSYFAKTISDFLHNCSVQCRSDHSGKKNV